LPSDGIVRKDNAKIQQKEAKCKKNRDFHIGANPTAFLFGGKKIKKIIWRYRK
jgi:hypothetical protein